MFNPRWSRHGRLDIYSIGLATGFRYIHVEGGLDLGPFLTTRWSSQGLEPRSPGREHIAQGPVPALRIPERQQDLADGQGRAPQTMPGLPCVRRRIRGLITDSPQHIYTQSRGE